ncbi:hypothetical protein [Photobacterium andalusiense]|uniref:Uncharacterized protein n=1 Tax=Photobacterium andalusiense TaxID=2204296 RepID=A0A1Y6MFM5_9GAMM|nr:hypothetical protein [Photobacterium andalusiense]SMY34699.1 hypothetical protein PAND9192_01458 [Photobacterium andalusiense]
MKLMPLLLLANLFSSAVMAQSTCSVTHFEAVNIEPTIEAVNIEPTIEAVKYDQHKQMAAVHHSAPMRCATISFKTSHTLNKVANALNDEFEATYADMKTAKSHLITFSEDDIDSGYIKLRRNEPQTVYACFSTSSTPISSISCKFE